MRQVIDRLEIKPFHRDLAVITLFVGLLVAFFWKVFFLGRVLIPADLLTHFTPWSYYPEYGQGVQNPLLSDPVRLYYPWRFYFLESLRKGVFPLWNPYVFSGIPFAANIQSAIFYPFKVLFMPLPLPSGYTYETILHVFLAGLFTYWFLRSIQMGRFGSLLASVAFMFSSIVVVWLEFAPVLDTIVWLPLILLLAERALQGNSLPYAALAGMALGIQFLAGFAQFSYYILIAASSYIAFLFLHLLARRQGGKDLLISMGLVILIFGLGFSLPAIQLVPTFELTGHTMRGSESYEGIAATAFPIQNLVTFLVPDFFGSPVAGPFWGLGNFNEYTAYLGIVPLLFAFVALVLRRDRTTLFFALLLTGSLLLALGTPFYKLLMVVVPKFKDMRAAGRFVFLSIFSIAVLAGLGADYLLRAVRNKAVGSRVIFLALLAFIAALAGAITFSLWRTFFYLHLVPPGIDPSNPSLSLVMRYFLIRGSFPLLILAGALVLTFLFSAKKVRASHFSISMVALLVIDIFHFGMNYNPMVNPRLVFFPTQATDFLARDKGLSRIIRLGDEPLFSPFTPNTGLIYQVADSDGSDAFVLERYVQFLNSIEDHGDFARRYNSQGNLLDASSLASPLLDFLNVKYVLTSSSLADAQVHREGQDISDGTIPVTGDNRPGQSFLAHYDGLNRIDVMFVKQEAINEGEVIFRLKTDPASPEHIAFIPVSISQLEDRAYHTFYFAPILDSKGRQLYFYLESPGSTAENAVLVMTNSKDRYPQGTAYLNDQPVSGDLRFAHHNAPLYDAEDLGLRLVFNGDIYIYENEDVMPRAFVVHRVEMVRDDSEVLKRLKGETFDPRHSVLIGEELSPLDLAMNTEAPLIDGSEARILDYEPNTVTIEARMESDGFLVLSDVYYPGWKAYVDDEERRIYRANYIFRAVYLDKGYYVIRFSYQPASFRLGSMISAISLLSAVAILGYAAYGGIHHRRERE